MKEIEAIVFDLGGVLVDLDIDASCQVFYKLGYPKDQKPVDPYKQDGIFLKLEEGLVSPEDYYTDIRSQIAGNVSDEQIARALYVMVTGIPEYKLDMLLELRKKGYKIFMLSNTNVVMFEYIKNTMFTKQGLTVDSYFDKLYLSYEMKTVKPDRKIFDLMVADCKIQPEDILFIDDGRANISTALSLGFETYLASAGEDCRHIFNRYIPKEGI